MQPNTEMTVDTDIVWQEPTPARSTGGRRGRWIEFVASLQEAPGKWAVAVAGVEPSRVGSVQARLKRRGCEATSRAQDDGTYTLYARWPEDKS